MTKSISVLHITAIFPPEIGGPSKQVWDLVNYQHKSLSYSPTVITFSQDKDIKTQFPVIRIPLYKNLPPIISTLFRQSHFGLTLIKTILKNKPDIVHCHDIRVLGLVTGLITNLTRVKTVIKYPGDIAYEIINSEKLVEPSVGKIYSHNTKAKILSLFQKFVLNLFDYVWVVSNYQKDILVIYVKIPMQKIIFMPNFIDAKTKGVNKKNKIKTILLVSRNVPWKQTGKIFNVLRYLPKTKLNIIICGNIEGQFKKTAIQFSNTNPQFEFKFLGKTSPTEMESIYKQADIFVSLSCYEPFGIVFVEASTFGLPVVAPSIGGIPEVVSHNHTGFLYKLGDWNEAAKQLNKLIENPQLYSRMSLSSQAHAHNFDLKTNSKKIDDFYQKIINE